MPQRKKSSIFIALGIFFLLVISFLVLGFVKLNQAKNAFEEKNYQLASENYVKVAKIFFWRRDLWEQAGIASALNEDYQQAISYLEKNPIQTEEGWVWLSAAYYQSQNIEKAISVLKSAVQIKPSARLFAQLAFIFRAEKNWDAERNALEEQLKFDAQNDYAHYRLGLLLILFSQNNARDELTRASTLNAELDSAVETLITALNIADTQNSKAEKFITLGRAMGLVQEWDLAYFAFEQAISADEKNAEAWAWLGEAKQQLGQDGSEEIGKALNLNPSSSIIHALSGLRWMRQENFRKALDQYKLAIQSEPENPAWYASAGDAYTKLGDLYAALEMYQRVTELTPQDASVWRRLAIFCAENSIYIEEIALPAAQQALTLLPNDSANLDTLAYVYFLSGRFANAEIYFLQAIEIDSEYFPAHLHLAMNYLAQGDRTKAYNTLTYIRDARASGVYRESALRLLEKYFP